MTLHLLRRDPLIEVLCAVVSSIYWFHPVVWLAARQMRRDANTLRRSSLELGVNPTELCTPHDTDRAMMRPSHTPRPCAGEPSQLDRESPPSSPAAAPAVVGIATASQCRTNVVESVPIASAQETTR